MSNPAATSVTWQRPQSPQHRRFCAITAYDGGSSLSACGGRWETATTYVLIGVDVGELECRGCRAALAAELPIAKAPRCDCGAPIGGRAHIATCPISRLEVAIRELRNAHAIRTEELHTASGVLIEGEVDGRFDDGESE